MIEGLGQDWGDRIWDTGLGETDWGDRIGDIANSLRLSAGYEAPAGMAGREWQRVGFPCERHPDFSPEGC